MIYYLSSVRTNKTENKAAKKTYTQTRLSMNKGYAYTEQVNKKAHGQTVLSYLSTGYTHSSLELWQQRIDQGEVYLNHQLAHISSVLKAGDTLTWQRPPWEEESVLKSFEILYEDTDLVLVNKPSGLPTVAAGGFLENTLVYLVKQTIPSANPAHRLGRATSGLVLFSKNKESAQILSQTWSQIEKSYLALASGLARQNHYTIKTNIGPVSHPKLGSIHAANPRGKKALSEAWVLERRQNETLFKATLGTGRSHQIRIHLASIGHPLTNDPIYTHGGSLLAKPGLASDMGYLLHAHRLKLEHPMSKESLYFEASPPPELKLTLA